MSVAGREIFWRKAEAARVAAAAATAAELANIESNEPDFDDRKVARSDVDLQRMKLERLMQNFDKPVPIPNVKKEWIPSKPPEFVRNVVGSSAGAGSGEYHIYRNTRKREFARQEFYKKQTELETLDEEYREKIAARQQELLKKSSRKRMRRLKKKARQKAKAKLASNKSNDQHSLSDDESSNSECDVDTSVVES